MNNKYRICLIVPEGNPHSLCFREIGLLLLSALKSNNLECDFTFNQLDPQRINIILGYHLLKYEEGLKQFKYIPYQLEQLHSQEFPFSDQMKNLLTFAYDVWDYSEKNIQFLAQLGIKAKQLIPGYHENLEMIPKEPRQTTDILFYGSIGERRRFILEQLSNLCRLKTLFGVYGEKRDKWICRSKINLNIHHYSTQIFEAVRISYLLNNQSFVISESSINYCYPKVQLVMVPYQKIIDTCMEYLNRPEKMMEISQSNYESFKAYYDMNQLIKDVI